MATETQRNSPAFWEEQLSARGLSMVRGISNRLRQLSCFDFEGEDRKDPDLKDTLEYKRDHLEAA